MISIDKKITPYNYTESNNRKIKYIVIHYVGAVSTAKNNVDYYASKKIGASAHYFVDASSIWQSVEDKDIAWHCGGGLQGSNGHSFYQKCTNGNSIGIEMCCFKDGTGNWFFASKTIDNTIDLVKQLMQKHNIPIENVIRHYDVTGKICPAPFVLNGSFWDEFKNKLIEKTILENGNDIIWELMNGKNKIEISEPERAIKALDEAKNDDKFMSLYWIIHKIVNK